jgi:thymidylate synthase ThyX
MEASASLYEGLTSAGLRDVAPYAVAMAYRVRFYMEMNAREAMHMIELRTAPQGHPAYRRVCQQMHRLIAEQAGHRAVAAAMRFADHSVVELERLGSERSLERKRGMVYALCAGRAACSAVAPKARRRGRLYSSGTSRRLQ